MARFLTFTLGVSIRWTRLLDWATGLTCFTFIRMYEGILISANDIQHPFRKFRPDSCHAHGTGIEYITLDGNSIDRVEYCAS